MIRKVRSLLRDKRGASVIELALVLPVFAAMLIGMVDISRAYSAKLQLEQASYRAIEKVQQYNTSQSTYSTLQGEAAAAAQAAGFTDVTVNDVVVDYWLECNNVRQSDYSASCTSGQSYARWVTVDIPATFRPMFTSARLAGANSDGSFTLHGKAGLRTQ